MKILALALMIFICVPLEIIVAEPVRCEQSFQKHTIIHKVSWVSQNEALRLANERLDYLNAHGGNWTVVQTKMGGSARTGFWVKLYLREI